MKDYNSSWMAHLCRRSVGDYPSIRSLLSISSIVCLYEWPLWYPISVFLCYCFVIRVLFQGWKSVLACFLVLLHRWFWLLAVILVFFPWFLIIFFPPLHTESPNWSQILQVLVDKYVRGWEKLVSFSIFCDRFPL